VNIIVCIKQVIDTSARIAIKDGNVEAPGSPRVMNPYDEYAVEEAVRLKDRFSPDSQITLLSLGPESFRDTLKTGLAMGADQAVHLCDPAFAGLDALATAQALAKAIAGMPYDLILCGRQAVDDDTAGVGPALGVLLNVPFVTVVTQLEIADDQKNAVVTRQIEGGSEVLEVSLPLVLTCQKGLNVPRLPSLKGIMAAKKKEVRVLTASAIGFDPATQAPGRGRQVNLTLPPPRPKTRMLAGDARQAANELIRLLRDEEKII
jgi:electron transfer flavoprotein beta subunit